MQRAGEGWVATQRIEVGEDGVEFRQHFFHLRQHLGGTAHQSVAGSAPNGVALAEHSHSTLVGGRQIQVHFHVAHEVARDGGGGADGQLHLLFFQAEAHHDVAFACVVVLDFLDHADAIAVGENRRRR